MFSSFSAIASDGTPILVERIRPEDGAQEAAAVSQQQQEEIQYTTIQSGAAAATSLIELSQAPVASLVEGNEQETILVQAGSPEVQDQQHAQLVDGTTMVEIQGHPDHGSGLTNNYILVTTGDNEQRLVPVSATTAEASHQQQVISEEEVVVVEEGEEREQEQQQLKTHNLEVIREEQEDESRAENQS